MSAPVTPRACGFTLIEVVVALLVFAIGLLGVAGMVSNAARTLRDARTMAWSVSMAGEVADSLAHWGVSSDGVRAFPAGRVTWAIEEPGPLSRVHIAVEIGQARIEPESGSVLGAGVDAESAPPGAAVRLTILAPGVPPSGEDAG